MNPVIDSSPRSIERIFDLRLESLLRLLVRRVETEHVAQVEHVLAVHQFGHASGHHLRKRETEEETAQATNKSEGWTMGRTRIRKTSWQHFAVLAAFACSYEQEHVLQRGGVFSERVERLEAALLEGAEERTVLVLATAHHERHLGREHEGAALAIETEFLLEITQEVTEINV